MWPQWHSALSVAGWAALAAVPPAIVALYFLKLRRRPLETPSTYLWRRAAEEFRVNSLWQKLRRHPLLWLQLLIVALAALALGQPSWRTTERPGERAIYLVDVSASMGASDVEPSRLEEAKRQITALVGEMRGADVGMLIAFTRQAHVAQGFTASRRELQRALDSLKVTTGQASLDQALRLASGLASSNRARLDEASFASEPLPATVYIFSDGRFPDVAEFALENLVVKFIPIGRADAANVGILSFATQHNEEKLDALQAFARLANFGHAPVKVQLGLYVDNGPQPENDQLLDRQELLIEPGRTRGAAFPLQLQRGALELRIETKEGRHSLDSTPDQLAADNRAWTTIDFGRRARVLYVRHQNDFLEQALTTDAAQLIAEVQVESESYLLTEDYRQGARSGRYDLVIYDRCRPKPAEAAVIHNSKDSAPPKDPLAPGPSPLAPNARPLANPPVSLLPEANTLWIGVTPPEAGWSAGTQREAPQIIDLDRTHPLLDLVELTGILVASARPLGLPNGGRSLVVSNDGSLMAIAARGIYQDTVLGFELVGNEGLNTDWPKKHSFPLFVLNVLNHLGSPTGSLDRPQVRAGESIALSGRSAARELLITKPDGEEREVNRNALGVYPFAETETLGLYRVREPQVADDRTFVVNLFGAADGFEHSEGNLRPRSSTDPAGPALQLGNTKVNASTGVQNASFAGWKPLVLLALVAVLIEWYIYVRRVVI